MNINSLFGLCHRLWEAKFAGQLKLFPHSGQSYFTFSIRAHLCCANCSGSENIARQSLHANPGKIGVSVVFTGSPDGLVIFVFSDAFPLSCICLCFPSGELSSSHLAIYSFAGTILSPESIK